MTPRTLADVLTRWTEDRPDDLAYGFLSGGEPAAQWSYAALYRRSRTVAARLREFPPGSRAMLLYGPGLDFVAAFYGCLMAGVVAVPAYPPEPSRLARGLSRLCTIAEDAGASVVLTSAQIAGMAMMLGDAAPQLTALPWVATDTLPDDAAPLPAVAPTDLAFLQYTSGSTAAPRGVMVQHRNILHNLAYIALFQENDETSSSLSWLPIYHDMGLIGGILEPLYCGHPAWLMSPIDFLRRPVSWLEAITMLGSSSSGGPNFAFDLCIRKTTPEQRAALDLSSWGVAYNGAEPIRADTLERFIAAFGPCGFKRESFYPGYGLAEATLVVSGGRRRYLPGYARLDPAALQQHRLVEAEEGTVVVGCGRAEMGMEAVIVDVGSGQLCPPDGVGEIWIRGPSVAAGYWGRPVLTQASFQAHLPDGTGPFFRTGDLGFLRDGELYVTGRIKDIVIIRGRNHYPQDIERTAEDCAGVRPGCTAAVGVDGGLSLVAEVDRRVTDLDALAAAIRAAVAEEHGLAVDAVALVEARSIHKTSSGKIQRSACRKALAAGTLSLRLLSRSAPVDDIADWLAGQGDVGALDSLAMVALSAKMEAALGRPVPLSALFGRSATEIAALLSEEGALAQMRADARLPDDIQPQPAPPRPVRRVLLTGATGFLGAHLLFELLTTTDAAASCLVRRDNGAAAIRENLAQYGLWRDGFAGRITPIRGDLSQPTLGLSEAALAGLDFDAIYHAGASVNWVYPYAGLRDVNVRATVALLRLASQRPGCAFHFVSTLSVCTTAPRTGEPVAEVDMLPHLERLPFGYAQSKCVAEHLVLTARQRGLSATVIRPGMLLGAADTGIANTHDFLSRFFKGCIELGCAPDLDWSLEALPVDVARRAIVGLGTTQPIVHLQHPRPRHLRECLLWLNLYGHPVEFRPYADWLALLMQTPGTALQPLRPFFAHQLASGAHLPEVYEVARRDPIEDAASRAALDAAGVDCPPLSADLLARTFAAFVRRGFLPPPARTAPPPASIAGRIAAAGLAVSVEGPCDGDSIIGELTGWYDGGASGLFAVRTEESTAAIAKVKPAEDTMHAVATRVAALCEPSLAEAFVAFRDLLGIDGSHAREPALMADPRLAAHTPRVLASAPGVVVMEDLTGTPGLDGAGAPWSTAHTDAALTGLAAIHAAWWGQTAALTAQPWMPARRSLARMTEAAPLWGGLSRATAKALSAWAGGPVGRLQAALVATLPVWWPALASAPEVLLHNDFTTRNVALREGRTLCAIDWELAALGAPQQDLISFLCFAGPSSPEAIDHHVATYRSALSAATGEAIPEAAFEAGISSALADFVLTRLPMYALVHRFQPQRYLPRVVATWAALYRRFPCPHLPPPG